MSLHGDPRIARIPWIVCANGHRASKVDEILVPHQESGHLPLQELNFGGQKSDSTLQAIGKGEGHTRAGFAGPSLFRRKIAV